MLRLTLISGLSTAILPAAALAQTASGPPSQPAYAPPAAYQQPRGGEVVSPGGQLPPGTPGGGGLAPQPIGSAPVAGQQSVAGNGNVQAPPSAGAQPGGQLGLPQPAQQAPRAPFVLNAAEQSFLDQLLRMWQQQTGQIRTFRCDFQQLVYIPGFAPPGVALERNQGKLSYAKPDKGSFKIEEIHRFQGDVDNPEWNQDSKQVGEHWVCDGENVYQFNHAAKELQVIPIAPELQGHAIADGPLPFLFGADADKMKQRYWMRIIHDSQEEVWLEAYPKFQADAANYQFVQVIFNRKTLLPKAMRVQLPGNEQNTYLFGEATINSPLDRIMGPFKPPSKPFGWTRKVIETGTPPQAGQPPATQSPRSTGCLGTGREMHRLAQRTATSIY